MMDRSYPTSSFADPLVPPAQSAASWAYERSPASIKPSYGAAHLDSDVLQRQSYASTNQLPTYTTSHHPTGLSGTFDSSGNTSETSIMSFLSAMESRSLQAGPASASLLPPFRTPSWPMGTNSSTAELYLTGALPSTATFPSPAALSSYQHTGAFPSRSYTTTTLPLQDPAFSTSTNGLFSHHDPLIHLKSSQAVLPTALAFSHLSTPSLGSSIPIQSSTYRSAQESAPHLLQPQFSLLPSALPVSHGASQPCGPSVFSGSIERALQRECSVIKHHQRPSSSHTASSEQLSSAQQSLQGYLGSASEPEVSYQQDPSHQTPASGRTDSTQGVNGGPHADTGSVTPETYSSASVAKSKDGSTKLGIHLSKTGEDIRSQSLTEGSPENYSSPGQKQSSALLARQSVQLPSMMSSGLSQNYVTSHTQSQPSHSTSDKIPSLYKTLPSFSSQSVASVSQALIYSSAGLHQDQDVQYGAQVQSMCQGNLSESYPSSHSQGAPNVSYPSQSPEQAAVTQTYATGQSLNSSYPSTCTQSLATLNSTQGFTLMQSSVGGKTSSSLSLQQTQASKYLLSTPSPMYTLAQAAHAQALQNNARPSAQDLKPSYGKNKHDELPIQELQAPMQAPMQAPLDTQTDSSMSAHNNVVYVVSKNDDRYKTQSVIRSSSREDQLLGLSSPKMVQVKDERIDSFSQQHVHLSSANSLGTADSKTTNLIVTPSQLPQSSEQLRQHSLLKSPELHQQNRQIHIQPHSPPPQTQYIRIPSTQFLLESNQMILLQQPLVHTSHNAAKVPPILMQPNQGSGLVQVQYLHMGRELMSPVAGETQSTQGTLVSEQIAASTDPTKQSLKDHYSQPENHPSHDPKSHFALNSICFPDSMLMGDDRSILSNVDDILAATVAACGVTPQDFVKATSAVEGDMAVMGSHVDAKDPYEGVDMRHMSPSFSSTRQPITNTNAYSMAMTLNGGHIVTNCQSVHQNDGADIHPNGDGGSSESDYQLTSQVYASSGTENRVKGSTKGIKREDSLSECPGSEGFSKKKARSASSATPAGPEENGAVKSAKRCGQAKRQNSRGSDTSSPSTSHPAYDGYQQQERMRQKIREVEEKQPEVKTGFMGSFLDFIKSGPKNQYSPTPTRTISRPRKPSTSSKQTTSNPLPSLPPKLQCSSGPIVSQEGHGRTSQQKRLDEELQKNLETLPSFSSDEEENTSKNQALRNSISSALSSLDESSDRRVRADNGISSALMKPDQAPGMPQSVADTQLLHAAALKQTTSNTQHGVTVSTAQEGLKDTLPGRLAVQLSNVAVEGLTDEELSDSGGEGMYRERDEFVVRNEDIESLKVTMRAGREPPAIWKVQKALLQKFVPELRDGKRVFSATNSYLGYFGDAKTMYQRVYVKFLDTVNKREYVRVCSRKPRCKPMNSLRGSQVKTLLGLMATPSSVSLSQKPRPKLSKTRAEPPPKKRKKWKEFSPAPSSSSEEEGADDDEFSPPLPFASRLLNTRTMKETFRSFVELLIGVALDEDVLTTLERENDELRLPHMKRVDGMITDNRKRLLHKLHIGQLLKTALDSFPEISVVTELKKDGETPAFKVRLSGKAYNKKTMQPYKMPTKVPLEYTVDQRKTQCFSLYHSLQHYKYHTYLTCKEEIASLRAQTGQLGQEETVQRCLQNGAWVEGLFDRFGELLSQVQQACR